MKDVDSAGCHCDLWDRDPAALEALGLPRGTCGRCEVCDAPGHTQAHPRTPTTGAWCDEHYAALAGAPLAWPGFLAMGAIAVTVCGLLAWLVGALL